MTTFNWNLTYNTFTNIFWPLCSTSSHFPVNPQLEPKNSSNESRQRPFLAPQSWIQIEVSERPSIQRFVTEKKTRAPSKFSKFWTWSTKINWKNHIISESRCWAEKKQTETRLYHKDLVKGHRSLDFYFPGPIVVFLTGNGCSFAIMELRTNASIYSVIPGCCVLEFLQIDSWEAQLVNNILVHQYWSLHLIECYKQYSTHYDKEWSTGKNNTSMWLKSNH